LIEKDQELRESQEYNFILRDMLVKDDPISKTQVIYISTCDSYAKRNRFKVGGVDSVANLKTRLSSYNSNRVVGDEWFYSDIFMVADYRNIEKRLEVLIGRFRDKKQKEILRMHYSDVQYIVEYLCERFDEDVDTVNERLNTFIENLNIRRLRPIVPPPTRKALASITKLTEDGKVQNETITSEDDSELIEKIECFLRKLSPRETITKKEVFDAVNLRSGRREKTALLEVLMNKIRPDIKLLVKRLP
jgi:hypothetical protein